MTEPIVTPSISLRSGRFDWDEVEPLAAFQRADGSGPARQQTRVKLGCDAGELHVRFECDDRDIWSSYTKRDDPLHEEEAVELFLAPGRSDPERYFEFEVNPAGALFDARIHNPGPDRSRLIAEASWDCPGIRHVAECDRSRGIWVAELQIPWRSLVPRGPLPRAWRANFYRIERPRDGAPEFSCWSPTYSEPADFHRPRYFGRLLLDRPETDSGI